MTHLFYFIALFPIMWESMVVTNPRKHERFSLSFKGKKTEELSKTQKTFSMLMLMYAVWLFVGFFSSQYLFFIALFILSFIPKKNIYVRWIDAFLSLILLILIIINKYHSIFNF